MTKKVLLTIPHDVKLPELPVEKPRYTNRLSVYAGSYSWTITLTHNDGRVTRHYVSNSRDLGRSDRNASREAVIAMLRELRNVTVFPHLHEAFEMVSDLVRDMSLQEANLARNVNWADIELRLFGIAKIARNGLTEVSLANTYEVLPEDSLDRMTERDFDRAEKLASTIVRGLDNVNFDLSRETVCENCFIVEPCGC